VTLPNALEEKQPDRVHRRLAHPVRLALFLERTEKRRHTLTLERTLAILAAKVEIEPEPLEIVRLLIGRNGVLRQEIGRDGEHREISVLLSNKPKREVTQKQNLPSVGFRCQRSAGGGKLHGNGRINC
jgi:hypothetical protein